MRSFPKLLFRSKTPDAVKNQTRQKTNLREADWAFHLVPEIELEDCWWYELMRERGHERSWALGWTEKSWLEFSPQQRKIGKPPDESPSVREFTEQPKATDLHTKMAEALRKYGEELQRAGNPFWSPPVQIVALTIDWRVSDKKLKRDFAKFVESKRSQPFSAASQHKGVNIKRGGRPRDVERRLVDLAIYRADRAGLGRKDAVALLSPLLQKFGFLNSKGEVRQGILSAKNWAATVREAARQIHPKP